MLTACDNCPWRDAIGTFLVFYHGVTQEQNLCKACLNKIHRDGISTFELSPEEDEDEDE